MELKRVVVTGLGALTPLGKNTSDFWKGISEGISGAGYITRFNTEKFKTKFACEIKGYKGEDCFDKKELRRLDLYTQFALLAAEESVIDAGLIDADIDKNRVGVIFTSGIGGLETFYTEAKAYIEGGFVPRFSPFLIAKMISDIAAGHISIKYGYRGPNFATVSACASSSSAIIDAYTYIRLGTADIIITGGSEAGINEIGIGGFNAAQALSTNNEEYMTASRPFDATRDGFVMGEGGASLVLEEYEHAKRRGAKIYAEVVGIGMSADAYHLTAPHPEGLGARLVMENALRDANLKTEDIDYINVHGTATPLGDVVEAKAIVDLFKEHAYKLNISSTKSMTGHLLGAAGAAEAIAVIMATIHDLVPPTINFSTPDPNIDPKLNLTINEAQSRKVNYAISNTFGFGGHNTCIIFKKFSG